MDAPHQKLSVPPELALRGLAVPPSPIRLYGSPGNHTIGNTCAIPGGRKSILRDAAAERFAVWPEDDRQ
jgi:hypothetical protein